METSFLRLSSESRISNYLGLKMEDGYSYSLPQQGTRNYAYIQIPVREIYNPSEESLTTKGLRNQFVKIIPACSVNVRGNYRFEVHPNPALAQYGAVQAPFYLEPEDGVLTPSFNVWLRKDLTLEDIEWAVRIYMRS